MSAKRWSVACLLAATFMGTLSTLSPASAQAAETAGMITEIRHGRGKIEVRAAGGTDWRPAGPLQAVRVGDAVRATGDAWAVIVLSGGRGSVRVDAAASPLALPSPQVGESRLQKAGALLDASVNYLTSGAKEQPQALLTTRGARPPIVLSPRNGPVLPGSLSFEWLGSRFSRYMVRVVGPGGVVLERAGITGGRFDYPSQAPPLSPGLRYTFQVIASGHPPKEAWFEVLNHTRAGAIKQDLTELEQALGPAVSPNSLAGLRAGFLAKEGLFHDARLVLVAALSRDPDEPTLHHLLGTVYTNTGLPDQAAESYDEARFLLTNSTKGSAPGTR